MATVVHSLPNSNPLNLCNPADHVLYGYCEGCPEVRQIKENGTPWADYEGYNDYLNATEKPLHLTPGQTGAACQCKDTDADQCSMLELGATYRQLRFKDHIDYRPCPCPDCHAVPAIF